MAKVPGSLKVREIKGMGLAVRDLYWKKSSDPYVRFTLGNQVLKTSVLERNLDPIWKDELTFWIPNTNPLLKLEVLDKDTLTLDDKMGDAEIDLQPLIAVVRGRKDKQGASFNDEKHKVVAGKSNCLVSDSYINYDDGAIVQDVHLRLRNVECGELKLRLKWVESELKY